MTEGKDEDDDDWTVDDGVGENTVLSLIYAQGRRLNWNVSYKLHPLVNTPFKQQSLDF